MLDDSKSYTQNKGSEQTRVEHERGQSAMYLWAPSDRRIKDEEESKALKGNKFGMLVAEKEGTAKDFIRRV